MNDQDAAVFSGSQGNAIPIPAQLTDSLKRHQQNLAALIVSLRSAGLDESTIESNVHEIVRSYEAELMVAIKALVRADDNA